MKKLLLSFLLILSISWICALPPGGPGGGGNPPDPCNTPFTPCWCQQNPGNPNCPPTTIPIDGHYWLLIAGGALMGVFYLYKTKAN
jgi:hypothetical protein